MDINDDLDALFADSDSRTEKGAATAGPVTAAANRRARSRFSPEERERLMSDDLDWLFADIDPDPDEAPPETAVSDESAAVPEHAPSAPPVPEAPPKATAPDEDAAVPEHTPTAPHAPEATDGRDTKADVGKGTGDFHADQEDFFWEMAARARKDERLRQSFEPAYCKHLPERAIWGYVFAYMCKYASADNLREWHEQGNPAAQAAVVNRILMQEEQLTDSRIEEIKQLVRESYSTYPTPYTAAFFMADDLSDRGTIAYARPAIENYIEHGFDDYYTQTYGLVILLSKLNRLFEKDAKLLRIRDHHGQCIDDLAEKKAEADRSVHSGDLRRMCLPAIVALVLAAVTAWVFARNYSLAAGGALFGGWLGIAVLVLAGVCVTLLGHDVLFGGLTTGILLLISWILSRFSRDFNLSLLPLALMGLIALFLSILKLADGTTVLREMKQGAKRQKEAVDDAVQLIKQADAMCSDRKRMAQFFLQLETLKGAGSVSAGKALEAARRESARYSAFYEKEVERMHFIAASNGMTCDK